MLLFVHLHFVRLRMSHQRTSLPPSPSCRTMLSATGWDAGYKAPISKRSVTPTYTGLLFGDTRICARSAGAARRRQHLALIVEVACDANVLHEDGRQRLHLLGLRRRVCAWTRREQAGDVTLACGRMLTVAARRFATISQAHTRSRWHRVARRKLMAAGCGTAGPCCAGSWDNYGRRAYNSSITAT